MIIVILRNVEFAFEVAVPRKIVSAKVRGLGFRV